MPTCQEVIDRLWDYLDSELPPEDMQAVADHLAECGRCYPQYRFEFAFLEALARQREVARKPSDAWRGRLKAALAEAARTGGPGT